MLYDNSATNALDHQAAASVVIVRRAAVSRASTEFRAMSATTRHGRTKLASGMNHAPMVKPIGQYGWEPGSRSTLRRARYDQTMKQAHAASATDRAIQNSA